MKTEFALERFPALQHFTRADVDALRGAARVRRFAAGELLCRQGDPGDGCFLLMAGTVDVERSVAGQTVPIGRLGRGDFVGQLALLDGSARSATVRALDEVTTLELTRDVFLAMLEAASPMALRFQKQVVVAGIHQLRVATTRLGRKIAQNRTRAARQSQAIEHASEVLADLATY